MKNAGLAYREKGDLEKARQDFQEALRDDSLKSRTDKYQAYIDKINEQLPPTPAAPARRWRLPPCRRPR